MNKVPENHIGAGRRGEDHALFYLQDKGFQLVRRNYRHGRGEIDLVMEAPNRTLVFVEVKSNRTKLSGSPLERVDGRKIRQLQKMAQRYCWEFRQEERDIRFDVVGVELGEEGSVEVLHLEGAFLPDTSGYYTAR